MRSVLPLALLISLSLVSCKPDPLDDDDSVGPDDDDSSGDDDSAGDDDDVTPDPACTDGWEPLAQLDDFEPYILDYSVDPESRTLAVVTSHNLRVFDISEPGSPVLLEVFDAEEVLLEDADWVAISAAEGGHVALGHSEDESGGWAHVQLVVSAQGSASIGPGTTLFTGAPDEYGTTGEATDIAAHSTGSVVVAWHPDDSTAYFFDHLKAAVALETSRTIPRHHWRRIAFSGSALLLPSETFRIVPMDPSLDVVQLDILGAARLPAEAESGWLVPTHGNCVAPNRLYRLRKDLSAIQQVGETELSCWSEFHTDGAHQVAAYGNELFVANGDGGLLRGTWETDDWISVQGPTTLTGELWEESVGVAIPWVTRVERLDDVLVVGGSLWSSFTDDWAISRIGLVRICPQ